MKFVLGLVSLASFTAACSSDAAPAAIEARAKVALDSRSPTREPDELATTLRSIAAEYASWHRVDEWNHWAPELCWIKPSVGRISASDDADTHGRKLYYLYAKDRAAYVAAREADQPIGQVVVKESWKPVEIGANETVDEFSRTVDGHSIAERDGKRWKPGAKTGLFVMIKRAADAPGTDAGWIYATTSSDGSVVHESGRVASCMSCHDEGTRDRLFGLKAD